MEEASNGKVKETLHKVEDAVKEDAEYVVDSVKGLLDGLVDGDSEPVAKEGEDCEDAGSSSSSDVEKEADTREEETQDHSPVVVAEETVEEVVHATVEEAEPSCPEETGFVPEPEFKEEKVAIVASSEEEKVVEIDEAVTEQISEEAPMPHVEIDAELAAASLVLPVEDDIKGDLEPKGSEDPSPPAPHAVSSPTEGIPPIIPVSHRVLQPTSWRSCCGLFEVLRRSDR